jgi:hypothetical protein
MAKIHMTIQGKGGVGKSVTASIIAQHRIDRKIPVICVDADPHNQSFLAYKSLSVAEMQLVVDGKLRQHAFEQILHIIHNHPDHEFIIDTGASGFPVLLEYLQSGGVQDYMNAMGHQFIAHTVVAGGSLLNDTILGLKLLIESLPDSRFVVWLNPFSGKIETEKQFEQFAIYPKIQPRLDGIVRLPYLVDDLRGNDFDKLLTKKLTFADIESDSVTPPWEKIRIKKLKDSIFAEIDKVEVMAAGQRTADVA